METTGESVAATSVFCVYICLYLDVVKVTIFCVGFGKHVWRVFCLLCILFFKEFCKLYERSPVNLEKFEQLNVHIQESRANHSF